MILLVFYNNVRRDKITIKRKKIKILYTYFFKSTFTFSLTCIYIWSRNRKNMQGILCQKFIFENKGI